MFYLLIVVSCAVSEQKEIYAPGVTETLPDISFAMEIAGEKDIEVKSILSDDIETKVSDLTLASYGPDGRLVDTKHGLK